MNKRFDMSCIRSGFAQALCLMAAMALSAPLMAQDRPIPKSQYPSALPPPSKKYPNYNPPARLNSAMEVFWEAVKQKESNGTHWSRNGVPLPGGADAAGIISIGISQISFTYRNQSVGPEKARDAGMSWSWDRYLYDPIYNEQMGRKIFEKNLRQFSNYPCAAMWAYNGGDGAAQALGAGRRSKNGTAWEFSPGKDSFPGERAKWVDYVSKTSEYARKLALKYGFAEEVAQILDTTPGCSDKMVDVDPAILKPATDGPYTGPPIEGYCAPQAAAMLRGTFEYRQKDLDESKEPLYRQIKTGGEGLAQAQGSGGAGSGSGGGSPGGSSGGGSSSGASVMEESYDALSSCTEMSWPTLQIQYPTMDQIIRGIAKEAVRRACSEARNLMTEQRNRLSGSFYLNTRLPGVPNAGVSTTGSGGDEPPGGP